MDFKVSSTSDVRLCFKGHKLTLMGYSNSNMARDIDSKKSTSNNSIMFARGVGLNQDCKSV